MEVIIHNQRTHSLQLYRILFFVDHVAQGKVKAYCEGGAPVNLTLHLNGAAHHVHRMLSDSHTKAGSLNTADSGALFPLEGIKNMLQKVLTHADTTVANNEIIVGMTWLFRGLLTNGERNHTANGREFSRIAQNIDQHLVQTQRVEN